jgi:hypothetical protein
MPPPPITAHIPQPSDVFSKLPPQVGLDCHARELCCDGGNGLCGDCAEPCGGNDGVFCEDAGGVQVTDAVEGLEGFLQEMLG